MKEFTSKKSQILAALSAECQLMSIISAPERVWDNVQLILKQSPYAIITIRDGKAFIQSADAFGKPDTALN